jgi:hypothetical protein
LDAAVLCRFSTRSTFFEPFSGVRCGRHGFRPVA